MKIIVTAKSEEFEPYAQSVQKALNFLAKENGLENIVTQEIRKRYMADAFKCGIVRCK